MQKAELTLTNFPTIYELQTNGHDDYKQTLPLLYEKHEMIFKALVVQG